MLGKPAAQVPAHLTCSAFQFHVVRPVCPVLACEFAGAFAPLVKVGGHPLAPGPLEHGAGKIVRAETIRIKELTQLLFVRDWHPQANPVSHSAIAFAKGVADDDVPPSKVLWRRRGVVVHARERRDPA